MVTVKGKSSTHTYSIKRLVPFREQFSLYTDAADEVELLAETYSDYYRNHRFKSTLFDETRAPQTLETENSDGGWESAILAQRTDTRP